MKAIDILKQEKELSFASFHHEDAYRIASLMIEKVEKNLLKRVRIRIVFHQDIIFQYLMDGKKGDVWLNRKQKTIEKFHHSGYYLFLENEENGTYQEYSDDESLVICGGSFPLIVKDEIVGCIIVSGLSHEQDHQLIVDALYQYQNRKVLASDIDGTLVFHQLDGLYRPNDLIAIKEFQNQGHLFGVCSGRPLCHFKDMRRLNLDFYIVSSGAVILDKDFHIIEEYPMAKDIAKSLCERYQDKAGIIVQSSSLNRFYATCCDFDCQDLYIFHDFQEIEEEKIYGISLIAKSEEEAKQLNIDIAHHYPELEGFQNTDSVDIVMRGCSKGKAVIKIKELLRVKEIAGIGDSYNDIPLLQNADVGFTFHDSPQIVKDQATYIVDSVDQAIAQLMEETV